MAVEVRLPQLGESIAEGTVVRWFKKLGERVRRDEPLFEMSTDKVDTEVPSPAEGYLEQILVAEGDTVPVDTPVCVLSESEPSVGERSTPSPSAAGALPSSSAGPRRGAGFDPAFQQGPAGGSAERERLSPAVRRLIRDHGLDVSKLTGTGAGGRITRQDVLAHLRAQDSRPTPGVRRERSAETSGQKVELDATDSVEPMSVRRRQIAEHMISSRRTSAHVSSVHEVDMTTVVELRTQLKDQLEAEHGVKLTYLPFVVHAVARRLREFPALNASIIDDQVHYKGEINIGIAVAIEDGLLVPVVKRANTLNILELARAVNDLASRARTKTLHPDAVRGGTFTITNPGAFGALIGTPIINQPQVAILYLGAVQKRVVVLSETDAMAIRSMAYLTLTFDHRLIDGALADRFLSAVRDTIERGDFELGAPRA